MIRVASFSLLSFFGLVIYLGIMTTALASTTMTYQGQLQDADGPVNATVDMSFQLFDDPTAGNPVGGPVELTGVDVVDGLFQVELDFGEQDYASGLWLVVEVDEQVLAPRQAITGAPFAISAAPGSGSNWEVSGSHISYTGGRVGIGTGNPQARLHVLGEGLFGEPDNVAGGNNAFVTGGQTGTINAASGALSFVGGGAGNHAGGASSFVAGGALNQAPGGASFVGGGQNNLGEGLNSFLGGGLQNELGGNADNSASLGGAFNQVAGDRSVIIGGYENTVTGTSSVILAGDNSLVSGSESIASGDDNIVSGASSAIIGAVDSEVSDNRSFIGGGHRNLVSNDHGAIIAGADNEVTSRYSVIAGGEDNLASGTRSFIAAGRDNFIDGSTSFAGGRAAHALHDGTFVWSDSSTDAFASTGDDQFLVRADGGVGFGRTPSDYFEIQSPFGVIPGDGAEESGALRVRLDGSTRFRVLRNGGVAIGSSYQVSGVPESGLRVSGETVLESGVTVNDDLEVNGDVSQPAGNTGMVKASAIVNCVGAGSSEARFFNNVTGSLNVTGDGTIDGCFVNFDFSLANRYWQVSAIDDTNVVPSSDSASCSRSSANVLRCARYDSSGTVSTGQIVITIY